MAKLASREHGVVEHQQLLGLGFTPGAIEHRLRSGRLHRVHRGVYAVGHPTLTHEGRRTAAVLACGPQAVLSHWSAATHWEPLQTNRAVIDVVVPGHHRGHKGIRLHCVKQLDERDTTIRDGIPITNVPRTLLDLATVANHRQLRRAVNQAARGGWLGPKALSHFLHRHEGRPGIKAFRAATAALNPGTHRTRSDLEDDFLVVNRKHGLPTPDSNMEVESFEVDFHFPGTNLIVELDSYEYHRTPEEFDADRRKDAALKRKGYEVLRVNDAWLNSDPDGVAETVKQLLEGQLELAQGSEGLALVQAGDPHAEQPYRPRRVELAQ